MASSQHAPALAICWDRHACGATGQGVGAQSQFGLTEWRGKSRLLWSKISFLEPLSCAEAAKLCSESKRECTNLNTCTM